MECLNDRDNNLIYNGRTGMYEKKLPDYIEVPVSISKFKVDMVNHPPHYNYATIEPIDVIEDWNLPYHLGNALKYISRAGHKENNSEIQDINKAIWYLKRYIELKENTNDVSK